MTSLLTQLRRGRFSGKNMEDGGGGFREREMEDTCSLWVESAPLAFVSQQSSNESLSFSAAILSRYHGQM